MPSIHTDHLAATVHSICREVLVDQDSCVSPFVLLLSPQIYRLLENEIPIK